MTPTDAAPDREVAEMVERHKQLAFAGDFLSDDLGGDIGTMSLRNPDGLEMHALLTRLFAELKRKDEALRQIAGFVPGASEVSQRVVVEIARSALTPTTDIEEMVDPS